MRRRGALLGIVGVLAMPSGAAGSTLSTWTGSPDVHGEREGILYEAAPGERNQLQITAEGQSIVVRDPGAVIASSAGCTTDPADPHRATCPMGYGELQAFLGDEDDTAAVPYAYRLDGGPGSDTLGGGIAPHGLILGGDGDDRLTGTGSPQAWVNLDGGPGNDHVEAVTDGQNHLAGGAGDDTVLGGGYDSLCGGELTWSDTPNQVRPGSYDRHYACGRADTGADLLDARGTANPEMYPYDVGDYLDGGDGPDRLLGTTNTDYFLAGAGDDFVNSRDGKQEHVHCEEGHDALHGDREDHPTFCEILDFPPLPPNPATLTIYGRAKVRDGKLVLRVSCTGAEACRGVVRAWLVGRREGRDVRLLAVDEIPFGGYAGQWEMTLTLRRRARSMWRRLKRPGFQIRGRIDNGHRIRITVVPRRG